MPLDVFIARRLLLLILSLLNFRATDDGVSCLKGWKDSANAEENLSTHRRSTESAIGIGAVTVYSSSDAIHAVELRSSPPPCFATPQTPFGESGPSAKSYAPHGPPDAHDDISIHTEEQDDLPKLVTDLLGDARFSWSPRCACEMLRWCIAHGVKVYRYMFDEEAPPKATSGVKV
ncbi:hypothetical protein PUNSTDRAFT_134128 [Punctularia strigosozonata HHB-11173 SS5]|uniref:uncharacterized protein n=1 Tax=Punctularia strigosozonata (strain HHB-11173) TaxID=741275 RepID=UPI00044167C7|nr:uncharacterized protein PUNSTDRAFT_134128 [Punctularia strigosozonata HHB-11173 SS5]EIN08955.1 hypothetical protein PUNSTDRAFT_134128 [Punctularia strigosozonata HHB-11173 SS5]